MHRGVVPAACLVFGVTTPAWANPNDVVISRLATVERDGSGDPVRTIGHNLEFRSLASELGVVMAPRLLTPSDTLGFGGFQFAVDVGYTRITSDASFWRAREGSPDPGGLAGMTHGPSFLPTIGFFARKGIWLPLPSFEVGAGAVHLLDSGLWSGQLYAKFGLHEGYHDLPIPSVAVRGAVSRMVGESEIDMTVASVDISISKHVGIGGTWNLSPYGGWNALIIVPRSEVIDPTPDVDPLMAGNELDRELNFVFKDQDNILRHRFFAGLKLQYYVFQFTFEAQVAIKGSSVDDRTGTSDACSTFPDTELCDSEDGSGRQTAYLMSAGLDF